MHSTLQNGFLKVGIIALTVEFREKLSNSFFEKGNLGEIWITHYFSASGTLSLLMEERMNKYQSSSSVKGSIM